MNYVPTGAMGRLGYAGMATGAGLAQALGVAGTTADIALSATGAVVGVAAIPVAAAVGATALGYKIVDEAGNVLNEATTEKNDSMEDVLEVVSINPKRPKVAGTPVRTGGIGTEFSTPMRRVPQPEINFTPTGQKRAANNGLQEEDETYQTYKRKTTKKKRRAYRKKGRKFHRRT